LQDCAVKGLGSRFLHVDNLSGHGMLFRSYENKEVRATKR
jgi:hypothetical protein